MIDTKLLTKAIEKSGLKKFYIAQALGLSAYGLHNKLNGKTEFKASEIKSLSELLGMSVEMKERIFFTD